MKILYESELTGKKYDTKEECQKAEAEFKKAEKAARENAELEKREKEQRIEERTKRAKEIEDAYKNFQELQNECSKKMQEKWDEYLALRNQFIQDYGEYHTTYRTIMKPVSLSRLLEEFFRF